MHGIKRRSSLFNTDRVDHLYQDPHVTDAQFVLHFGDLADSSNLTSAISVPQKLTPSWAMPPKLGKSSDGPQKSASKNWSPK